METLRRKSSIDKKKRLSDEGRRKKRPTMNSSSSKGIIEIPSTVVVTKGEMAVVVVATAARSRGETTRKRALEVMIMVNIREKSKRETIRMLMPVLHSRTSKRR